jgi:hypothetical protein
MDKFFPVAWVLVDEGAPRSARQSPSETGATMVRDHCRVASRA